MPEEVLFKSEQPSDIAQIAGFLRSIADKLESQGYFTLEQDGETVEIRPTGAVSLELKFERETPKEKYEFEIEIGWRPGIERGGVVIR